MLCDSGPLDLVSGILTLRALLDANRRFGHHAHLSRTTPTLPALADRVIRFARWPHPQHHRQPRAAGPAQLRW